MENALINLSRGVCFSILDGMQKSTLFILLALLGAACDGPTIAGQPRAVFRENLENVWDAGWKSGPMSGQEAELRGLELARTIQGPLGAACTLVWSTAASQEIHSAVAEGRQSHFAMRDNTISAALDALRQKMGP